MRESYPPADAASSPAPELPEPPQQRFQFSLKHLLAFMLVSAVLAAFVRYAIQVAQLLPAHQLLQWFPTIFGSLTFGGLAYFFFRVPFLALHARRIYERWTVVRGQRRELEKWSRDRVKHRARPVEPRAD